MDRIRSIARCPSCGSEDVSLVLHVRDIPTHSCVLLDDPAAARAFPKGDLALSHCSACDFLYNAVFDPERMDYSEDYEETQGCSPTFSRWLEDLAEELVERCSLDGGRVAEIGCGRGDFLELLCRKGNAEGVGIDPSGTAGRVDLKAGRGLRFLWETYSEEHASLDPELIVCRHTLEHIGDVDRFLRLIRSNIGSSSEVTLFIEVPDVARQLAEGAFWDFYYEHASYFSAGSLSSALMRAGFEVEETRLSYSGQYLQAFARPTMASPSTAPDPELQAPVRAFRERAEESIAGWSRHISQVRSGGGRIALWGSGSKATGFLTSLENPEAVDVVVDINPAKHGKFVAGAGQRIASPSDLVPLRPDLVVVMNPIYRKEIAADLEGMGLRPALLAVGEDDPGREP